MSYSNYGGQDFTGVDHVRLLDGFKRLRASGYIAKGNIQAGEGREMKTRLGTRLPTRLGYYSGAIWWEAREENQTWPRDGGYNTASNPGLYIRCMAADAQDRLRASMAVAEEAIKVLRGLSPIIVEAPGLEREYEVIIYCPPMTRLEDMPEGTRETAIGNVKRAAEAQARIIEADVQRAIHKHADVLCDQGILRGNTPTPQDVVEFMEEREATIERHLNSYPMRDERPHGMTPRYTPGQIERIKREGTSLAQERLRGMLTDVTQRLDEAHFITLPNLG